MRSSNERLLIIEDDTDTRDNLCDILDLDGWAVDTASSAREAFDSARWPEYAAILLDRRLPDGDGARLLPRFKQLAPQAGVIMITGFADLDGAISALRLGAADYILKPINPEALHASLERLAERRRAALALRESEQRLRAIFENALDGLVIVDQRCLVTEANPAACKLFCLSRDEMLAATLARLFGCANGEPASLDQFLQTGVPIVERELFQPDGARAQIEYQTVSNFLPGLHLFSLRDVTGRKLAEERARQAERLAAIGETMAGLVHEGRNALQRSKACLEMLALEVEDRPEALDLVGRVQRAQDDLHRLYEEVRQYAAPINLEREPCRLRAVWRDTWANLTHSCAPCELSLREEVEGDPVCEADYFALGQVFRNIFENAIQVSPPNSQLVVRCREGAFAGNPAVVCSVRDQGPGMTREQRRRVFEPFFTTKSKGTGLGMAIAQRIVQSHGGALEVADCDGPGAEIILTLPKPHS